MEKIIVDGYNVIHRVSDLQRVLDRGLEDARVELILRIKSFLTRKKVEVIVVFDGDQAAAPEDRYGTNRRLRVLFSRAPAKADSVIISILDKEKRAGRLTLVSDDREIVSHARSIGAKTLSAQSFYERLTKRPGSEELNRKFDYDISPDELDEWIDLFSRDDGDSE